MFDTDSITVEDITEFKGYHGLHISAVGYLDCTRIPVRIDIGFGDVVYPDAVKMEFPVILDMEPPMVNAYFLESAMAEKLEAIVHNGYLNSRYKDFYDIYVLSTKYAFSLEELRNAVAETFKNDLKLISRLCISYVFRRSICDIQTNSLNMTFATLKNEIKPDDYVNSIKAFFVMCSRNFILSHLENYGNKTPIIIENYTIEHIMPHRTAV